MSNQSFQCIQVKSSEANKIHEQNNEAQLKIKEMEHNISKHHKESQDAADEVQKTDLAEQVYVWMFLNVVVGQVSRMLNKHDWIHAERHLFGQPNSSYDFKTNNPREAGQRLKKLEETTTKLERNVNKRAMNMLNEAEERVRVTHDHQQLSGCFILCPIVYSTMNWWKRNE